MNEAFVNKKQVSKFRQWSGKSYAVFASIGKEVNIGHVDINICDKASEKNNRKKALTNTASQYLIEEIIDQEEFNEELLDSKLISMLTFTSNIDESSRHCCNFKSKYYFKHCFHPVSRMQLSINLI